MWRALVWLGMLAALSLGIALWLVRPLVAAACPACFGLSQAAPRLYMQSTMPPALRAHVIEALAEAERRVGGFFGGLQHSPRVLVCADDACYRRIGGIAGSGTGTAGSWALVVSPQAVGPVPIAEALAQVELYGRVGYFHMTIGTLPMWFDEGVAVLAADDRLYVAPPRPARPLSCRAGARYAGHP
jgi:hypothetical protein